MEQLLEKIAKNTEPKRSFQIIVSDNKTRFITKFNPPIQLDKKKSYEIALCNLQTYYSFPNIDSSNNHFKYSPDAGVSWVDIYIPPGSYELDEIEDEIQHQMKHKGHYNKAHDAYYVTFTVNTSMMKTVMTIENKYQVDFTPANSISSVLGFDKTIYESSDISTYESENTVNIMNVNSILVNTDIISGSCVNIKNEQIHKCKVKYFRSAERKTEKRSQIRTRVNKYPTTP